jgi:integrase
MTARQRNDGLRKRCDCPRRAWAKCTHPWHFSFRFRGEDYRFSLSHHVGRLVRSEDGRWERELATLGKPITDKTSALNERERLRTLIRDGKAHQAPAPQTDALTVRHLVDVYRKQYLDVHRAATLRNTMYMFGVILRHVMEQPDGSRKSFGDWLVRDVTTDTIEQYRRSRLSAGTSRHHLELLRALFNWAASSKRRLAPDNPFLDGSQAAIKLVKNPPRTRRLHLGEGDRLLAECGPHLWSVVQAALETGMRRGEILSLQWWQVRGEPPSSIFLPSEKTKTKADRTIPVSSTLRAILQMRRTGPDGEAFPPHAYVFGNELGERVQNVKHAWERALLKAQTRAAISAEDHRRGKGCARHHDRAAHPGVSATDACDRSALPRSATRGRLTLARRWRAAPTGAGLARTREHQSDEYVSTAGRG